MQNIIKLVSEPDEINFLVLYSERFAFTGISSCRSVVGGEIPLTWSGSTLVLLFSLPLC